MEISKQSLNAHKNLLCAKDLVSNRCPSLDSLVRGLKEKCPKNTDEEKETIQSMLCDLKNMLSQERIDKSSCRNLARIDENKCILVERFSGKWNNFGYSRNKKIFLYPHEALYFMEMDNLELYYNSVIVSLEQAYILLLDDEIKFSITAEEYFVYRQFTRMGFNCQLHVSPPESNQNSSSSFENLVWKCLNDMLHKKEPAKTDEEYLKIRKSMTDCANQIKNPKPYQIDEEPVTSNWYQKIEIDPNDANPPRKKRKFINNKQHLLDLNLYDDKHLSKFKKVFHKMELIKLTPIDAIESDTILKYSFDVYNPKSGFKKSQPKEPNYRIIVLSIENELPTRQMIASCYLRQTQPAPVIVVYVNESMATNAFIYHFSI